MLMEPSRMPENEDFGWFEDVEHVSPNKGISKDSVSQQHLYRALSNPPPATEPPEYILESNLETQQLWYTTAGQRPRQPSKEREFYEKLWSQNFETSAVVYSEERKSADIIPTSEFNAEIIEKGKSPFSNAVSKSFANDQITSMTVQVPEFRVMKSPDNNKFAEFLVRVTIGTVTFGIWKRHSDFSRLAHSLSEFDALSFSYDNLPLSSHPSQTEQQYKNTSLSWQCVLQRKKWFKCLDKDYLSLKCFLLERFMHDLLFESPTPSLISRFLGLTDGGEES